MQKNEFLQLLESSPIIAAAKDMDGLQQALQNECRIVFTLFGDIMNIPEITRQIKAADRVAMVHMDLIDGLGSRDVSVDFIQQSTEADGIITTKSNLVRRADECGLLAVQRFFLLDSKSLGNIERQDPKDSACAIELLPGLMPKIIRRIADRSSLPIIAGGLISDKEDVMAALGAGACAVSTTNPAIWRL